MLTETAIAHLHRHQNSLAMLVDRVAALLGGEADKARLPLAAARWSIARCAREYQLFKHIEIFGPTLSHGHPAQVRLAGEMRRACLDASADFETHLRRWSARDVVADWELYRAEAWAVVRRIRRHLAVERQQVAQLLAGTQHVRRRA